MSAEADHSSKAGLDQLKSKKTSTMSKPISVSPRSPKPHSMPPPPSRLGVPRPPRPHRSSTKELKLPSLPRFHPANFSSQSSSTVPTPNSGGASPLPPVSPRSLQRQYSEAQKQLYAYQRELLANAGKAKGGPTVKPISPRLVPAGSPGPVTPLELETEQRAGYLLAGGRTQGIDEVAHREYVETLIMTETGHRKDTLPRNLSSKSLSPKRTTVSSY